MIQIRSSGKPAIQKGKLLHGQSFMTPNQSLAPHTVHGTMFFIGPQLSLRLCGHFNSSISSSKRQTAARKIHKASQIKRCCSHQKRTPMEPPTKRNFRECQHWHRDPVKKKKDEKRSEIIHPARRSKLLSPVRAVYSGRNVCGGALQSTEIDGTFYYFV